ncbi:hypothetical protein [Agarilytica rhodophyticola]|uniref:hypothetical protein n=1 Tax=Agarilytica rhodophyticola TaxID=1737490 RepID=UPI000B34A01E|nr:hypothetical protein [Agarilytica rhodophyticola]
MSFKKHNIFTSLLILSIVVLCAQTHASSEDRKKRHRKPPLEAFEACANLSEEQACSFVGRRDNTVEGTCIVLPFDEEAMVCKPAHRRKKHRNQDSIE